MPIPKKPITHKYTHNSYCKHQEEYFRTGNRIKEKSNTDLSPHIVITKYRN